MTADRITVGPAAERDFAQWASETIAEQASEITALRAELNRRKGDPVTRLHNICEAVEEVDNAYSKEEFERLEAEIAALRRRVTTYGQHKMDCVWHWHRAACDCGFEASSPPAEKRESGTP
jgi:hypothetical protein